MASNKTFNYAMYPEDSPSDTRSCRLSTVVGAIVVVAVAFCLGVVCYWRISQHHLAEEDNKPLFIENDISCSAVVDEEKFDCHPEGPATEGACSERGCCYNNTFSITPNCFYPSDYVGYKVTDATIDSDGIRASLERATPSGFPRDIKRLNLVVSFMDDYSLRLKITDADATRFEVPIPLQHQTKPLKNRLYNVHIDLSGNLIVSRKSSGAIVFKTALSQLVYSDQFLQISTHLPSTYFYGIGEHYDKVLRSANWTKFTLFNSDLSPIPNHALYGSQPFYISLEPNGKANGVFLLNSNPMDVMLQPTPAVTFRPIGGILDFFVMLGPSPENVVQQYTNILGRSFMPPYWSLGFHLCKYGYRTLNNTREVWNRTVDAGIPFDVQWNDIDYMDRYMDFTYDKDKFAGLPEFVEELHENGMHYVMIIDPGISDAMKPGSYPPFDDGLNLDIFVKNSSGQLFRGKVWNYGNTVYPDFSHPQSTAYWTTQFKNYHSEVKFDGAWIDMNEPSNFYDGQIDGCPNNSLEHPIFVPGGVPLQKKTVCMSAKHYATVHYNEHNLYAYREANATYHALKSVRGKRPFVISRASFSGLGYRSGHWSGDVFSTWEDMQYSIQSLLNFNMYGVSMMGSDICGFNNNVTVELCARWQTLGAFYTFSRNHNEKDTIDQDPVALGPVVVNATKTSLLARYRLLPYLYTLFYRSHVFGVTVARPLFFEFPEDSQTYDIDEQFLWGRALMIMPALYPGISTINAYFPKGVWYDFFTSSKRISTGQTFELPAPLTSINLAVRGGHILPMQIPSTTTTASRLNDFILLVALNENKEAEGELFWDDGDSIDTYEGGKYNLITFKANKMGLNSTVQNEGYPVEMKLGEIKVLGLDEKPNEVYINNQSCPFTYNKEHLSIDATGFNLMTTLLVNWKTP